MMANVVAVFHKDGEYSGPLLSAVSLMLPECQVVEEPKEDDMVPHAGEEEE